MAEPEGSLLPRPVWYPVAEAPARLSIGDIVYVTGCHNAQCCAPRGVVAAVYSPAWVAYDGRTLAHPPTHFLWLDFDEAAPARPSLAVQAVAERIGCEIERDMAEHGAALWTNCARRIIADELTRALADRTEGQNTHD